MRGGNGVSVRAGRSGRERAGRRSQNRRGRVVNSHFRTAVAGPLFAGESGFEKREALTLIPISVVGRPSTGASRPDNVGQVPDTRWHRLVGSYSIAENRGGVSGRPRSVRLARGSIDSSTRMADLCPFPVRFLDAYLAGIAVFQTPGAFGDPCIRRGPSDG